MFEGEGEGGWREGEAGPLPEVVREEGWRGREKSPC